ncbi:MAG: hypothetical protein PHN45_00050 [Methylococcales bacterium]|nr:hypothetical protein [Methylococcales bacterium]
MTERRDLDKVAKGWFDFYTNKSGYSTLQFKPRAMRIKKSVAGSDIFRYDDGIVVMDYFGRDTFVVDDYDYYVDLRVIINGVVVVDSHKQ